MANKITYRFIDEQGTNLNKFLMQDVNTNETKTITLARRPTLTQTGTLLNANNLNPLIDAINSLIDDIENYGNTFTMFDSMLASIKSKEYTRLISPTELDLVNKNIIVALPTTQSSTIILKNNNNKVFDNNAKTYLLEIPYIGSPEATGYMNFVINNVKIPIIHPKDEMSNYLTSGKYITDFKLLIFNDSTKWVGLIVSGNINSFNASVSPLILGE